MKMPLNCKNLAGGALIALSLIGAGSSAQAADHTASRAGVKAWSSGAHLGAQKIEDNNKGVFGGAYMGASRVVTDVTTKYLGVTTKSLAQAPDAVEACIDNGWAPAACSARNVNEIN